MKRQNLKNEVCSVKYDCDLLFLGIGCTLFIVRRKNSKVIDKFDPFFPYSDKIYGIEKFGHKVLLFGGQSVQYFEYEFLENVKKNADCDIKITLGPQVFHFKDWIIKARLFELSDKLFLTILFAHNFLCTYDIKEEQEHDVWCEEKCLLYSGEISDQSTNGIIVFSGTVFKEILIWSDKITSCKGAKILHRLKGHNGVIFSVHFDASKNLICSTSDDRSVRLWKVKGRTRELVPAIESNIDWSSVEISLQTTMFGHTARVWTLAIGEKSIVSIGEDSQICIWAPTGKLIHKIHAHNGAPIWNVDICEEKKTIVTGAGDGSVYEWKIDPFLGETKNQGHVVQLADKQKMPKHVRFLGEGLFLVMQEKSELCCIKACGSEFRLVQTMNLNERLWNYSLIAVSPRRRHVALASINGYVTVYHQIAGQNQDVLITQLIEGRLIESKIFSIHFLDEKTLLICGSGGCMKTFTFNENEFHMEMEYVLPLSRERWVTAAVKHEKYFICGDRAGSIFVFVENKTPVQTLYKVHNMGVQSCAFFKNKLVTTGRDGTMRFFNLRCNENLGCMSLSEARKKHLPMWWVAKILIRDEDLLVFGFNESDFVIYSTTLNRVLQRISCGGGHRSWDFFVKDSILQFLFIREKKVHFSKINLEDFTIPPLMEGFHTKPILAFHVLFSTKNSTIFVSGSEDCSLKISRLENSQMKVLMSLDGHISNIRCIDVITFANKQIIFSGGGRAQLKIWQVDVLSEEIVDVVDQTSFMLKGTDKDRRKKLSLHNQKFDFDPETRFMDVKALTVCKDIWIFLACSDGYLRILLYDTTTKKVSLRSEVSHDLRCILKLHCFVRENENKKEIIVLTMMTNGFIHFWKISNEILKLGCVKLHQCGINSYDIWQIAKNNFVLATGGDDNMLKVTRISIQENEVEILSQLENCSAHCAKIAGIKFLDEKRLLSAGADEKVFIHEFNETEMKLTEQTFTTIPDVQGLTTFAQRTCETQWCIFGRGIEIFNE